MDIYLSLLTISGALLIGAISPGPSFVLVARTSIAVSRIDGLSMAVGMGMGSMIFAVIVLTGLQAILATVPWLYLALKIFGGVYLIYLAIKIWRGAKKPLVISEDKTSLPQTVFKSFGLALFTQLSNPKAVVVYGSIFAALLPQNMPFFMLILLPILAFVIEAGWYATVAIALSTKSSAVFYLNAKTIIDRVAGAVMGALGLKLLVDAK